MKREREREGGGGGREGRPAMEGRLEYQVDQGLRGMAGSDVMDLISRFSWIVDD